MSRLVARSLLAACLAAGALPVHAQAPPEVSGVHWPTPSTLAWDAASGADRYNVYRVVLRELARGAAPRCAGQGLPSPSFAPGLQPAPGDAYGWLVSAVSSASGEGTLGVSSSAVPRSPAGTCERVLRQATLARAGFGWNEWTDARYAALGASGYVSEQLAPETISEADNADLNNRLAQLLPVDSPNEVNQVELIRGSYARRQLQQLLTVFWDNHFNTDMSETAGFLFPYYSPSTDPNYPARLFRKISELHYDQTEGFRSRALSGTFRQLAGFSAKHPAMLIYLDTVENVKEHPNENYARELLELHTMGVDGGYTQHDVTELARVMSGWTTCQKDAANVANPLAPCLIPFLQSGPWAAHFDPTKHDGGAKVLFAGTPRETTIPDTSAAPAQGVNDLDQALDAIVAHPSTRRFVSKKLIQLLLTETPTPAMIDAVAGRWETTGGAMREVVRAVFELPEMNDPEQAFSKLKTPYEHIVSAIRALHGDLNQFSRPLLENYLYTLRMNMHLNPVPTGYPEAGLSWINTNAVLDRQKLGIDLATNVLYGANPAALASAYGVTTPEGIVDFFAQRMFGGRLTPLERQRAITFLTTDDAGVPQPGLTPDRINQVAAFLLGLPQFQEQ